MDPDATLDMIAQHLTAGDNVEAKYAADDLLFWIERGGFDPDWSEHPEASEFVSRYAAEKY